MPYMVYLLIAVVASSESQTIRERNLAEKVKRKALKKILNLEKQRLVLASFSNKTYL